MLTSILGPVPLSPPSRVPDIHPGIRPQFRAQMSMGRLLFLWKESDLHRGPLPTFGYLNPILWPRPLSGDTESLLEARPNPDTHSPIPGPRSPSEDQTSIRGLELHGRTPIYRWGLGLTMARSYVLGADFNSRASTTQSSILGPRHPSRDQTQIRAQRSMERLLFLWSQISSGGLHVSGPGDNLIGPAMVI